MTHSIDPHWVRGPNDKLAIEEGCTFVPEDGQLVIDFIESFCKQSKGEWGGQPLRLLDWQKDFLMRLYGWKRPDGTRRFRSAYVQVAKKNGKSTMVSGIAIYHLIGDGEPGAEVHCNACDTKQARIVFDEAMHMIKSSPDLDPILKCTPSAKTVVHPASASKLQANSADVDSKDGINSSLTIFDELHRQHGHRMWHVYKHAGIARREPLRLSITTAGSDRESVCFDEYRYSKGVLAGTIPDTRHLAVIYEPEPNADIDDPATWKAANPSMGVTFSQEEFAHELAEAKQRPSEFNEFLRLRLNIWTQAHTRAISRIEWDKCGEAPVDPLALRSLECCAGLDLSSISDLTALVLAFRVGLQVKILSRFWIPEATARERDRAGETSYLAWAREGYLTLTPGNVIDYAWIRKEINSLSRLYKIKKLFTDPWNATQLSIELAGDGIPVENFRQGFLSMNAPTKELERMIASRELAHGNHPVLNWCADNAEFETDAAGNVKFSKSRSREKIDGMIALTQAVAALMANTSATRRSVYESRGVITL